MRIINSSFENVKFPTTLTVATVIPVHKNEDKQDKNDYRPVAIANVISWNNVSNQMLSTGTMYQTNIS